MQQFEQSYTNCDIVLAVETNLEALKTKSFACEYLGLTEEALACSE